MNGKNFEKTNSTIALIVLYVKKLKIYLTYISKFISSHENQIIIFMIPKLERCQYLITERLTALLRGMTSNHDGYFYCLNCLHSFNTSCS